MEAVALDLAAQAHPDMAVSQSRALPKSQLFLTKQQHPFALWRTSSRPEKLGPTIERPFPVHGDWPSYLASLGTRMWPFAEADRSRLGNWGYLTAGSRASGICLEGCESPEATAVSNARLWWRPAHDSPVRGT